MNQNDQDKKRYYGTAPGQFIVAPVEFLLDEEMTFSGLRVLLTLARYANAKTGVSYPSIETICENTGMLRENVSRTISMLQKRGWLMRRNVPKGMCNIYDLKIPNVTLRTVTSKKRTVEEQAEAHKGILQKIYKNKVKHTTDSSSLPPAAEPKRRPASASQPYGIVDIFDDDY